MIDRYIASLAFDDLATTTRRTYASAARAFARWYEESEGAPIDDPGAIVAPMLVRYRQAMRDRQLAPATINLHLAALDHLLKWAARSGIRTDPTIRMKREQEQPHAPRGLSERDQSRLVAAAARFSATPERDGAIVAALLHVGLRVSELCGLLIDDVQIADRSGSALIRSGKGAKRRRVPLNSTVRAALSTWLAVRPDNNDPRVFPLTPRAVGYMIARLAKMGRVVADVSPHTLRHTFVYNMRRAGVADTAIADIAGHSSLNTTRCYGRASFEDLGKAAEAIAWE